MSNLYKSDHDKRLRDRTVTHGAVDARLAAVALPTRCGSQNSIRILRLPEVVDRVGLKRASIYLRVAHGSFPKQISLGVRAVGWLESEIDTWLAARVSARHGQEL